MPKNEKPNLLAMFDKALPSIAVKDNTQPIVTFDINLETDLPVLIEELGNEFPGLTIDLKRAANGGKMGDGETPRVRFAAIDGAKRNNVTVYTSGKAVLVGTLASFDWVPVAMRAPTTKAKAGSKKAVKARVRATASSKRAPKETTDADRQPA